MKLRILFILITASAFIDPSIAQKPAKKITISGTVTDEVQKPVQGAIILIDKQNTHNITDRKGHYKVRAGSDAKLIAIMTMGNGYSEVPVDGRTIINFTVTGTASMQNAVQTKKEDEEMINIGYGTVKKKDLTTSVGKIDGRDKKYAAYTNIYEMIRGEVPGVQVNGRSILIQGVSSINMSTEPLFVVDGVVLSSVDDISPQMVQSIEILKGPSAAIYGSRGANGVILIFLKGAERNK